MEYLIGKITDNDHCIIKGHKYRKIGPPFMHKSNSKTLGNPVISVLVTIKDATGKTRVVPRELFE